MIFKFNRIRILLNIIIIATIIVVIYFLIFISTTKTNYYFKNDSMIEILPKTERQSIGVKKEFNVWLIFMRVNNRSPLKYRFYNVLINLFNVTTLPLSLHVIVDNSSRPVADVQMANVLNRINKNISHTYYDFDSFAKRLEDIVAVMTPHFSSKPGTYFSDALFYLSLALYRIAPKTQKRAVLIDLDLYFVKDISLLFDEFDKFKSTALFGLAPELSPVYRHILHMYKAKHNTTFGEYYHFNEISKQPHPRGFQGYNSGVVLLNLDAIRTSSEYHYIIKNETVDYLTKKYKFHGNLGDQDFYTLAGYEYPHLFQTLNCGFNRQLCVWWREHGYSDIFNLYYTCNHSIVVLHGNCNSRIPKHIT